MKTAPSACCLTVIIATLLACLSANAQEIDPETGFPWGKHNAPTGYISHFEQGTRVRPTRAAMTYAYRLLAREDKASQAEGARVLRNVIKYQDSDPNSKTYGVWSWYIEKPFKMDELDEVRIAVGVEFLKEGETPSSAPVTISDDPYSTKNEGAFYRVDWEPVDTSASPLLAPCKSTKY